MDLQARANACLYDSAGELVERFRSIGTVGGFTDSIEEVRRDAVASSMVFLFVSSEIASDPSRLFYKVDRKNLHGFIHGFRHVVEGKGRDRCAGEGFDFNASFPGRPHGYLPFENIFADPVSIHRYAIDWEWMAQGDEKWSSFHGLDGSDSSNAKGITFSEGVISDSFGGISGHGNFADGSSRTLRNRFFPDIDHMGSAILVDV